jgi:DNA-binding protein Alba
LYKESAWLPKDKIITYRLRGFEFPAIGAPCSKMFPIFAAVLIIGSVILMLMWQFQPFLKEKALPVIIDLLSVAEEKQTRSPIYLASTALESEYRLLVKQAEKIVWLGFTHIGDSQFNNLLNNLDNSTILRLVVASKTDTEKIKAVSKRVDRTIEIVHRPRIQFKILATENTLAVSTASLAPNALKGKHELTIISSDQFLVKEAQQYLAAFHEGSSEYPKDNKICTLSSELPQKSKSAFVNTSNGLNDLVHELLSSAKDSVLLISPYITNEIAECILNIIPREVQVKVITSVNWRQWPAEQSDPEALETLLSNRVFIDNCPNLCANCIIVDNQVAIISSQNLTFQSWFSRDQAGIYTRNQELIKAVLQRIESWQPKHRFTMELLENEIASFNAFLEAETEPPQILAEQEAEDAGAPIDIGESIAPPLLGFSTLTPPKPIITTLDHHPEQVIQTQLPDEPEWFEDIVYVGTKRTIEYVRACQHQIKRKGSVTIRARGRLIYRAVDVAEKLRMLEELELILNEGCIKIETYYPTGKDAKWGGISQIAITLHQKNQLALASVS